MEKLILNNGWVLATVILIFFLTVRYFFFTAIPYFYLYILKKNTYKKQRIQKKMPSKKRITNELKHSFISTIIIGFIAIGIFYLKSLGITKIYTDVQTFGATYFILSVIIYLLLHDTYFYWMHRIVHHPKLFNLFHKTHHLSRNPTPFTSFSFDISEAILEFILFPLLILVIPIHPTALIIVFNISIIFNVIGHLGYEFFPHWFVSHPILKWLNTSTHHNMHHQRASANFGLYFNFWDTWMRTNHKKYKETFISITTNLNSI